MIQAQTLAELFEGACERYESRTAYVWRPEFRALRFSFGEMRAMAARAAALLEARGIGEGERVILWAANSPYWVAAYYGCQLKGVVAVPLMAQNTPDFVSRIAEITQARLVLKSPRQFVYQPDLPAADVEVALAQAGAPEAFAPGRPEPDDTCQVLFTSGTTGTPKGVVLKHRNILANVRDILSLGLFHEGDPLMSILPLAHAFEQMASLYVAMALGFTTTQAASLAGLHIRMNMAEDHPRLMVAVPEFLKLAMQQIEAKAAEQGRGEKLQTLFRLGPRLPMALRRRLARPILERFGGKLELIISGGSALDPAVGEKWEALGVMLLQGYGATECSPVVSANHIEDRKVASVGHPLPSVEVRLAEDGEILVKGPNVVDGYYERPEETAARFRDGWYYTDDVGAFDNDGQLHIRGRKKFLIVTPAGENVYPEDVEAELNREPEVRDSAVLGWERAGHFEIHAVLLPKAGVEIDPGVVTDRANRRLQPHQRVQGASVWDGDDFPRTVTRKVKKNDVKAWLEGRGTHEATHDLSVPVGAAERVIAQVAGISPGAIRPEMRLDADLKLDSLGRIMLVGLIEEELGIALDEGQIGPEATVADVKALVGMRAQKDERYGFSERSLGRRARRVRGLAQRLFFGPLIRWLSRLQARGCEHLDGLKGPALFLPNHICPVDAAFVLHALPRRLQPDVAIAAATDVLYEHPSTRRLAGLATLLFNTYPFARQGQVKSSLQYTGRVLDRGYSVMLFPEGQMSQDGKLQEIKGGAGLLAVAMGVPVVPVGITGTDQVVPPNVQGLVLPRRGHVCVAFGEPLTFPRGTDYQEAANRIREAIAALLPPDRRG